MSRPKAHYSMVIKNHITGTSLKVELIDLPFSQNRQFRLRVNGQWARNGAGGEQDNRDQAGPRLVGETLGMFSDGLQNWI